MDLSAEMPINAVAVDLSGHPVIPSSAFAVGQRHQGSPEQLRREDPCAGMPINAVAVDRSASSHHPVIRVRRWTSR